MDSSNDKVLEELNTLNQKLEILESDVTKNTNTLQCRQVVELERQCWVNTQCFKEKMFWKDWSTQVTFKQGSQNEGLRFATEIVM